MLYEPYRLNRCHLSFSRGLTLPEMMVRLSLLAILLSIAAPTMNHIVADRRIAAVTQQLYGSVMLARSEAVKRRITVSLCQSSDGDSCADSSGSWGIGWLVFEDINENGKRDTGEMLIRIYDAVPDKVELSWNNGVNLGFNSKGQARKSGTFTLCEAVSTGHEVREVVLSLTGRARVTEAGSC